MPTYTVRELVEELSQFEDEAPVLMAHRPWGQIRAIEQSEIDGVEDHRDGIYIVQGETPTSGPRAPSDLQDGWSA